MSPTIGKRRYHLLTLLLYLGLAIASTWPLVRDLAHSVPRGNLESTTVPLVSAWALWWTSDRLPAGFEGYWDAPILDPAQKTFAYSESMTLLGVVSAPVFWLGGTPMLAYNLVLLAALVVNGWMARGLLRALRLHRLAAGLAGAIVVLLPYTQRELGVLTLVPLAGILGTLWALLSFTREPSRLRALSLAVAFAAAYLICGQHALMLVLAVLPASLWLIRRSLFRPAALRLLVGAGLISAALIAPVAMAQFEVLGERRVQRSEQIIARGAASASTWWTSPWRSILPVPGLRPAEGINRRGLFPGAVKLTLALLGLAWGLRHTEHRRAVAFLGSVGTMGFLLSMLPGLELGDLSLSEWLRKAVPGIAQIRSIYRAGVLTQVSLALLAGYGLHALLQSRRGTLAVANRGVRVGAIAAIALGVVATVELWPLEQGFGTAPRPRAWRGFIDWVDANVGRTEVMAYLPIAISGSARLFEEDAGWMALQATHGRSMVNGYSSYMPPTRLRFSWGVRGFPDAWSHAVMRRFRVRWVVAPLSWLEESRRGPQDDSRWREVYREPKENVAIYEVLPGPGGTR